MKARFHARSKAFLLLLLTLLLGAQAYAQPNNKLVMLFESDPGTRPVLGLQSAQGGMSGFSALLDANGDEVPDLLMRSNDDDGNLLGVLVINAASLDTLFRVVDLGATLGLAERDGMKLFGFADADTDGKREAVFANGQDVWLVDPDENALDWSYSSFIPSDFPVLLRAITDITDDSFPDIVLFLPQQRQTQVWGTRQ